MRKASQVIYKQLPEHSQRSMAAASEDTLRQLAFDNAAQANIIFTVSSGKIVMANTAACKLLGYSKKILLTRNRSVIFDIKEAGYKKMLKQRTAEGHSKALVTVIKKSGRRLSCEITSAVFKDEDGIEKSITSITDMSQSILEQQIIDTKKEKLVADNIVLAKSKQKGIDTKKEKLVADNIVLAKSKQKKIDIKKEKVVAGNIMLAKSKQKGIDTQKEKLVADNIVLAKSKQKKIDIKKEKVVAGNIMLARSKQKKIDIKKKKTVEDDIILATAKSDKEKLNYGIAAREQLLIEYEASFKLIFITSSDVLYDFDLVSGEVTFNSAYEQEFGYAISNDMKPGADWFDHIYPEDKAAIVKDYDRMLASGEIEWKSRFRFLRADGSIANVVTGSIVLRKADGKAFRRIGYMQDVSKQKVVEERLEQEIRLKEIQIAEAMEDAKETERSDIGKELHDNINQLLSVSKLYLDMAKRGGENSEMYLSRSSEYTLSAIEEIRKLSKGLTTDMITNLGLCDAIMNVTRDTMEVHPVKISCSLENFVEHSVNNKFKLAVFRIVQEELNNILKHARATEVSILLSQDEDSITLTISDNGVGFDTGKKSKGIGIDNIRSRAESYNGSADFVSQPQQGCILTVKFPFTDALLSKN